MKCEAPGRSRLPRGLVCPVVLKGQEGDARWEVAVPRAVPPGVDHPPTEEKVPRAPDTMCWLTTFRAQRRDVRLHPAMAAESLSRTALLPILISAPATTAARSRT